MFLQWLSWWRSYYAIRSELMQHSHRELHDLGLSPGDIDHIARLGATQASPR
jgi:uncharacterized protein YjiS (DUF1127 family)